MYTFSPGPSAVHAQLPQYFQEAFDTGILSMNHRSPEFIAMNKELQEVIRCKLEIPADYVVMFSSSATECWENIAQSIQPQLSLHFYNGAFGEKWASYHEQICGEERTLKAPYEVEEMPDFEAFKSEKPDLVCLTHNETSNATQLPENSLHLVRRHYPEALIALDATSSMAGLRLPFNQADIWYASVQKCFGLPAGMSVIILSPKAQERAMATANSHYNALGSMIKQAEKFQTTHTPNVSNIYLLLRTLQDSEHIAVTDDRLHAQWLQWKNFLSENGYELLVKNELIQSKTVLAIKGQPEEIREIKAKAKAAGILLGNGYGAWKDSSFRIANFPAIPLTGIQALQQFLSK